MKRFFTLLFVLLLAATSPAQDQEFSAQEKADLQAYANHLGSIRDQNFPGARQMHVFKVGPLDHINTNYDPVLEDLLDSFYDGARFAQANYAAKLQKLQKIVYIDVDPYFLGEVSKDGSSIYLNSNLKNFKNLNWIIFHRQMGKLYGMKEIKTGHEIMSAHWEIDVKHEDIAEARRSRPHDRKAFFDALAEENPLKKKI